MIYNKLHIIILIDLLIDELIINDRVEHDVLLVYSQM